MDAYHCCGGSSLLLLGTACLTFNGTSVAWLRIKGEKRILFVLYFSPLVCAASVDSSSGDVYWLTCARTQIMVTSFSGMMTKLLYQVAGKSIIWHLFLDCQRASLYWLETGKSIQRMDLEGRNIKELGNETWAAEVPVTLDISSSSFLWTSKEMGNGVYFRWCVPICFVWYPLDVQSTFHT